MTTTMTRPTLSLLPEGLQEGAARGRGRPRRSPLDLFETHFRVDASGCWLWTGARCGTKAAYGQFTIGGYGRETAHRAAWLLYRGPIPAGLDVMHLCDVPLCVNPAHLKPGTRSENLRHAAAIGGWVVKRNVGRKITAADAVEIRRAYAAGEANQPELARRFGLSQPMVGNIIRRRKWAHAEEVAA